jgi:superfamily I DNA and/or RNA helicase
VFVKNLESVQGDERDHMIVSTTYGPDPNGRFYRRFGPLGRAGGGRRLNVLVTRAREEVLVTSIPREHYGTSSGSGRPRSFATRRGHREGRPSFEEEAKEGAVARAPERG